MDQQTNQPKDRQTDKATKKTIHVTQGAVDQLAKLDKIIAKEVVTAEVYK